VHRLAELRQRARGLKRNVRALYWAGRDPRTPWYAKAVAACTVAYALSPIDLIPDFIPVIGYLDDLILVPAGIALAIRLIPRDVWQDCCDRAEQPVGKKAGFIAAVAVIIIWSAALFALAAGIIHAVRK
jgi:uncharacterized membrane protein YkvA (DUF1232 family)